MNSLSWFLYLADVLPAVSTNVGALGFIIFLLYSIFHVVSRIPGCPWNEEGEVGSPSKTIIILSLGAAILANFIPERDTIYLIAGSEVGEVVVNSPEAREILNDVKTVIKQQIKEAAK